MRFISCARPRQRVPDFVLLKMSYEMPAQIRRQLRNFRPRFLNTTLAEQSLPSLDRLTHFLGGMRLSYCDQLDFFGNSANSRGCLSDLFAHSLEIFSDRNHRKNVGQALRLPIENQGALNSARRTSRLRQGYDGQGDCHS